MKDVCTGVSASVWVQKWCVAFMVSGSRHVMKELECVGECSFVEHSANSTAESIIRKGKKIEQYRRVYNMLL